MISEELVLSSTDGLDLEARLERAGKARAAMVICHPHPRQGGTMNAPLLLAVRDALVARSWAVVRFNFRGVGASEGTSSDGRAEVADAVGALRFISERFSEVPHAIAGWSFGGAVAIRAAAEEAAVKPCVAIAPAVRAKPGVTAGLPSTDEITIAAPLLIVCGANDKEISPSACRDWAESLPGARYVEMPGANHFFWGKYDDLTMVVTEFVEEVV